MNTTQSIQAFRDSETGEIAWDALPWDLRQEAVRALEAERHGVVRGHRHYPQPLSRTDRPWADTPTDCPELRRQRLLDDLRH